MARPIIGITCLSEEEKAKPYAEAVAAHGGLVVLLPALPGYDRAPGEGELVQLGQRLDGLLLSGGGDLDPSAYGQPPSPWLRGLCPERDALELALARWAIKAGLPVLGICRGLQVLNVAGGGTLYQDVEREHPGGGPPLLPHEQEEGRPVATHPVQVEPGTLLWKVLGRGEVPVNSFHHQAARVVAPGWVASARAPDGLVEWIELPGHPFALGVQWHPEELWTEGGADNPARRLFVALVEAARQRARGVGAA
ncbi:MAG: gamma-glutamyl-gamma-aminobutyrate hydrolase family protein [Bacillota bacterium]|nr:gamma-glutamyl-gamma-aminobutyrate hydrolase family protein [Bacillota bacterium]